jgi:hypothetical protein
MAPTQRTRPAHRRARRNGGVVVGIVVVALLIAGGTVAAIVGLTGRDDDHATTTVSPTQSAGASAAPTTSASPSPSPSAERGNDSAAAAAAALRSCRTTVDAAQAAVTAARTGAGHWSIHTRARTDFLAHRITLTQTNAEFARTKLLGPADQKAFADALAAYEKVADGCDGVSGAADRSASTCATKAAALQTSVVAGQAVMKDWAAHLNNMALHADHEMSATQAREEWIAAWKAAPEHLNAFSAAESASTKTPSCPAS